MIAPQSFTAYRFPRLSSPFSALNHTFRARRPVATAERRKDAVLYHIGLRMVVVVTHVGGQAIPADVPEAKHVLIAQVLLVGSEDVLSDFPGVGPCLFYRL